MSVGQYEVYEIVNNAGNKVWDIPEFQRAFVWSPEQVKKLVEALYREYPIGTFLLWESSEYQESKTAQGSQTSVWIVDGQQRTTALCLLLGKKPYWWEDAETWNEALKRYNVMINIERWRDDPDHPEFALSNPVRSEDPRWISVREVLSKEKVGELTPLIDKITDSLLVEIRKSQSGESNSETELRNTVRDTVHDCLHKVYEIRKRYIPTVTINHEVEEVAEIFTRLNQEGTRVKEADVILALAAVRNKGWVRKEYQRFRKRLQERGWNLEPGIFIRTITGIGAGRARLRDVPKDFWNAKSFSSAWKYAKKTIKEVLIIRLSREYGIMSPDLLPSKNALIPLFVLHHYWGNKRGYSFEKALHWFLLANRDGRYSGAAITTLNKDIQIIRGMKKFDEVLQELHAQLKVSPTITEKEFLENRYHHSGSLFLKLMLYLVLFNKGARDWKDGTRIGYDKGGSSIASGFKPEWHHIYPRSVLRKAGKFSEDEIHSLANITVLNERTNRQELGRKPPWKYIYEVSISEEELRRHLTPESFPGVPKDKELNEKEQEELRKKLEERWSVERYREFLRERAKLLAEEANKFLKSLESGKRPHE